MKIGRNEPCPCGSGKKFKNCCLGKEQEMELYANKLNIAFGKLYSFNINYIKKSNDLDFKDTSFEDAMFFTLSSNFLGVIKALLLRNYFTSTTALNIRNTLECYVLMLMDKNGDINSTQKQLFCEQYKILEYNAYHDIDTLHYLVDIDKINKEYIEAKNKFLQVIDNKEDFYKISTSRVPFLCDKHMSFNKLFKKYCPNLNIIYSYLSIMVHPSNSLNILDRNYYNHLIKVIIDLILTWTDSLEEAPQYNFYHLKDFVLGFDLELPDNYGKHILDATSIQCDCLTKISDSFTLLYGEHTLVNDFLTEMAYLNYDISTDMILSLCENTKIKVKTLYEKIAQFNYIYFNIKLHNYYFQMLKYHSVYSYNNTCKQKTDNTQESFLKAFDLYKQTFINSKLTKNEFAKKFKSTLGYLINQDGDVPTLSHLVHDFLFETFKNEKFDNKVYTKEYLYTFYIESQLMSHASGYLYFSNSGAWGLGDDINVNQSFTNMLIHTLAKIKNLFDIGDENNKTNKEIKKVLDENISTFIKAFAYKMDIMISHQRISIPFE